MHSDEAPFIMPRGERVHPSRRGPIFFPPFRYISIQRVAQDGRAPLFRAPLHRQFLEEGPTYVPEDSSYKALSMFPFPL